ncbi:hypothetical protein PanWU01x14_050640 [Parasponia andersonii]|uniref:Uncharacterized protein n=1 Tax=Parasponia andersonii TaxID=3476 RepID=A0A2P5DLR0_PARAD|nr:hypothetical protein PanWU01x14_050640 [Parasponia andersonii]
MYTVTSYRIFHFQICLVGAAIDRKLTTLEAVTLFLYLPPSQLGSMLGLNFCGLIISIRTKFSSGSTEISSSSSSNCFCSSSYNHGDLVGFSTKCRAEDDLIKANWRKNLPSKGDLILLSSSMRLCKSTCREVDEMVYFEEKKNRTSPLQVQGRKDFLVFLILLVHWYKELKELEHARETFVQNL